MHCKAYLVVILLVVIMFSMGCENNDEDPTPMEINRNITTLRYILDTPGDEPLVTFLYQDLDGMGGNEPLIQGGTLKGGTVYFGNIEVLDESTTPLVNFSDEINADKENHQFFFNLQGLDANINYADADNNRNPIGLFTAFLTGDPGMGTVTINLQRNLNKFGSGVADGSINNAGGTTDIQVTFPVTIE